MTATRRETRAGARAPLAVFAFCALAVLTTQVEAAVARARRCPPAAAYSGPPYFAYLAHRRMPGNQGDPFIIQHAPADARFLAAASDDQPRCP
jgi:hypothetical protein